MSRWSFDMEIHCDAEALDVNGQGVQREMARMLRKVAFHVQTDTPEGTLLDGEGHRIGTFKLREVNDHG